MLKIKKNYRNEIILFVLMVLICCTILCFGQKKVLAENAPITVNNFEQLQEALSSANQDTEIIVSQTINLSSNVSLDGHGATVRVEKPYVNADGKVGSGYSNYGVFIINGNVNIKNMKIMGGSNHLEDMDSIDYDFAAIQIQNGTVDMQNIIVTRSGRGISIKNGACVILSDSQIVRNSYSHGGGICCKGKLIMNNCCCSENRTTFSDGGGGAMEINGLDGAGELYANNTIIANNASKEVGGAISCLESKIYLINCTVTGNVTTNQRCYGGGVGFTYTANQFYAANCVFVNNYYLDQENIQVYASDIGKLVKNNVLHLYNCLYNSIVKGYSDDDTLTVKTIGCKIETEEQNVAKTYREDGIFLSKDKISQGFLHPAAVAKPGTDGLGLYIPIQGGGLAATGGTNTYFDFSDLNNIKMGFGSDDNITALGNLNAPSATAKISNYYEDGSREAGIIGASGIDEDDYYTVKLADYEHGTVEGATFYGDTNTSGTSVTVKAIENVDGYVFKDWIVTNSNGDEEIITDNPYTFEINENITLLPEFVEGYRYYVVFDENGATSGEMDEVSFISDLGIDQYLPENVFLRKGYSFVEWNTEADGTGTSYENQEKIVTNLTDIANAQVILYAQWKPNEYKIKFDGNGATSGKMAETSFVFDTEGYLPKNVFSRTGYSFVEWNTGADGTGTSYKNQEKIVTNLTDIANAQVILYAQWKKDEQNIEKKNYGWSTIENAGGSSGGGSPSSSTNQDLISKNELTDIKTQVPIKSELPEKLQTRKYLIGYDNEKIKPENYVTNAEFATVIYRLMNNGKTINYDKLEDIGVKKSDWFANAVAYLTDDSRKIINITDKNFRPNENIKGYEVLNIIHSVLKFYNADKSFALDQDLNSNVTRAKMTQIIFKAFERKNNPGQKIYSDLNDKHWAYNFLMDASE